ncbi:BMC domain-containing protein [Christensenella tenuis]|nr:BMC domain-containing protein [Christensenella tenuis]
MNEALGLLEVRGLASSIMVMDAMMKAAETGLVDIKKDMGGGLVTLVVEGEVSAVTASVQAGIAEAERASEVIAYRIMANPDPQTRMYLDNSYREKKIVFGKEAFGIIEVYGFICAMTAADAAVKAANVRLVGMERTKGSEGIELIVALKLAGLPDAVRGAVDAGLAAAAEVGDVISSNVNALPCEGIYPMIQYTNLKSD